MKNKEDEEIVRIILFGKDLQEAQKYFEFAREQDDKFVRDVFIKMAIIIYSKPFMANSGINKGMEKYRLPKMMVPEESLWLHEIFLSHRGNFIGHSNFKTMQPSMGEKEARGQLITWNDICFDHWFEKDLEYPDDPLMIDTAIELTTFLAKIISPETFEAH